jgi:hypothetical protein
VLSKSVQHEQPTNLTPSSSTLLRSKKVEIWLGLRLQASESLATCRSIQFMISGNQDYGFIEVIACSLKAPTLILTSPGNRATS